MRLPFNELSSMPINLVCYLFDLVLASGVCEYCMQTL